MRMLLPSKNAVVTFAAWDGFLLLFICAVLIIVSGMCEYEVWDDKHKHIKRKLIFLGVM